MSVKLTSEEIKLRGSLLAKNKDLLKLHKDLVFSNVLSEEEFWEDRRGLLKAQEMVLKQKKGVTSALVSDDLKPVTSSGSATTTTGSDVKYVLTPTIIQTIFQQHPILKRAFTELVKISGEEDGKGKLLSEREFWIEYFKSKFFNESLNSQQKIGGSIHLDPFYHEETASTCPNESSDKSIIPPFPGQLDISRSEDDHVSDYIQYEREASANGSAWNSLRQFNKHSLRVLESTRSSENHHQSSANNLYNYIEIPDLQEFHPPLMAPLNIQESQLFSLTNSRVDNGTGGCEDLKENLKTSLDRFETEEFDPKQFQLNYPQHKNLFTNLHQRNNFIISSEADASSASSTLNLNDEEANNLLNSATEILRHFWKSALKMTGPVTSASPDQNAKLTRFISVLEEMETKILDTDVDGGIFRNLKETIDRARTKYSEIMAKTNAKIINK